MRCCIVTNICLKEALLDLLHNQNIVALPSNEQVLHNLFTAFKKREEKNLKSVIRNHQWQLLCHVCQKRCLKPCPRKGKSSTKELDVTCLCLLFKNIEKIIPGFNVAILTRFLPYVEDARVCRNFLMHSTAQNLATYGDFDTFWKRLEANLKGLDYQNMNLFYNLKTSPLEPYTTQQIDWLTLWYQQLNLLKCDKTEITRLENVIVDLQQDLKEMKNDLLQNGQSKGKAKSIY